MMEERQKRVIGFGSLGWLLAACAMATLSFGSSALAAGTAHQVTLVMKEFKFEPDIVHLKVGEQVVLTIRNEGGVEHEWSAGQRAVDSEQQKGYRRDLVALLKPTVTGQQYELEKVGAPASDMSAEGETVKMLSTELDVEPGGSAVLRFTVPAAARGTWEFGCFVTGHYESGMKGTLVIE